MRIGFTIVFVSDMAAATAFYRDVLGLPLKFESPNWTEFSTGETGLALHPTATAPAARAPGDEPAGSTRIGFQVPDLDAFHERMLEHGVPCIEAPAVTFGAKLAQYQGPDRLVFSVGETRG